MKPSNRCIVLRGASSSKLAQISRDRSRCLKRNRPRRNWRSNCGICRQKKMRKAVALAISITLPFPFLHRASFLPRGVASRTGIFSAQRRATNTPYGIAATRCAASSRSGPEPVTPDLERCVIALQGSCNDQLRCTALAIVFQSSAIEGNRARSVLQGH